MLNIVFAGTPEFTIPSLNALLNSEHNLLAIYTQPDRPAGRGRTLQASAVKQWAIEHSLPVYQPLNFKDPEAIKELAELKPDVIIVIAYGLILPQIVLELPKFGCINVHASLLPRFRGAAPIQSAILHGDHETGVTIMQMDAGMDTGDMLTKQTCVIKPTDTAATLHDRLAEIAAPALLDTLTALTKQKLIPIKQDNSQATYAPKIHKTDAAINWHQPVAIIDQMIRAYNPWPVAYTQLNDLNIRVFNAHIVSKNSEAKPGTIIQLDKHGMLVNTLHGVLCIDKIQYPGGKVLSIAECLGAHNSPFHVGSIFQ